jgi:nitrogen regulatory protein PII
MIKMKKLEIIAEAAEIENIIQIFESAAVSGYTIINDISGKGGRGNRVADELTDVFKNKYILTVCDEQQAAKITEAISPLLKKRGGVCIVSDVLWVKH